jgi:hypothetical protein
VDLLHLLLQATSKRKNHLPLWADLQDTWHPSCRPEIYSAGDERVSQFMSPEFLRQGTETAKVVALSGHKQELEDGPDISTPEREQEEHGDVLEGM